jgi:non-canonical purine NTP pyrophosphatase (RdgB/HAM1 family)
MSLYFVTGNQDKLAEIKAIIPDVEAVSIDLPEIQDIDARAIIEAKLEEAFKHRPGPFIVEDTSLYINALNGLPGPLIKWFLKSVGTEGVHKLSASFDDDSAYALTLIGYADANGNIEFFEGKIDGTIVAPRGDSGFGWDAIFLPDGSAKTFGEMSSEEKNLISMRKLAAEKLKQHLAQK